MPISKVIVLQGISAQVADGYVAPGTAVAEPTLVAEIWYPTGWQSDYEVSTNG